MRKNAFILPAFALAFGIAGLFLRLTEQRTVLSGELAVHGAQVTTLLIAAAVAVVLVSLVFAVITGMRYASPEGFENAFGPLSVLYALTFFGLGIVWLIASAFSLFIAVSSQPSAVPDIYLSALSALSALSVMLLSIWMYKEPTKNAALFFCVIPPLFMCLWLVLLYRENSSNPVLLDFCYESLAIITSAMAFYYTAGFIYGRPAPGKAAFSYLTSVFFCLVTLADGIPIRQKLIFAVMLVMNLINASLMIARLGRKEKAADTDMVKEE